MSSLLSSTATSCLLKNAPTNAFVYVKLILFLLSRTFSLFLVKHCIQQAFSSATIIRAIKFGEKWSIKSASLREYIRTTFFVVVLFGEPLGTIYSLCGLLTYCSISLFSPENTRALVAILVKLKAVSPLTDHPQKAAYTCKVQRQPLMSFQNIGRAACMLTFCICTVSMR